MAVKTEEIAEAVLLIKNNTESIVISPDVTFYVSREAFLQLLELAVLLANHVLQDKESNQ